MKAFIGLLNKERLYYINVSIVLMGLMLILVWLLPVVISTYNPLLNTEELRGATVLTAILLFSIVSIFLFISSIKRDLRSKELWLHNAQLFWKLVLAKYVYQFIQMFIINALATIGNYFCGRWIEGTFIEITTLNVVIMFIVFVFYIFVTGFVFLFYVLNVQLKKVIGKLASIGVLLAVILFINFLNYIPDFTIPFGEISTKWIVSHLPDNMINIEISVGNLNIVEDIIYYLFFALLFLISCKWLERIVTR